MELDFFPYGVQYYRQPTPLPGEWEKDLKNIKEAGYTHIQLRPQWKWAERIEGEYYFDDIDQLMDLALKYDLRVIIKPMVECAPDWIFSKYGGSRIGFKGLPIPPISHGAFYVGGWLPCFDNPKVKEGAANFAREVAKRYKDHPALWFYNAWNEPRSRPGGQCQCEHSKKLYREWLKEKCKTIESLNAFFGKAYTSFESIDPPCSATDYVEMMLWRTWAGEAVSSHIKNIYDAIKSVDPDKPVMCHVGCCQIINDPVDDTTDDIKNASVVDFYGTSFPVSLFPEKINDGALPSAIGDWLRRVDNNFWIQEFYPCQGEWGKPPHNEILRRILWQSISTGCQGWTYWQYRSERVGNESNGWAMREINGDETDRSKVCDSIGKKLAEHKAVFAGSKKGKAEVAQIFHYEQDMLSRLEEWKDNFITEDVHGVVSLYKKALLNQHAIYASVLVNGMDFVTWFDDFSQYKAIVLAGDEIITPSFARKLKEYVNNGGNLIIEYPFACRDMNTWVSTERPNNSLEELTGVKELLRYNEVHSANFDAATFKNIPVYVEGEALPGTEIHGYWDNGKPCAFKKDHGKGKVFTMLASPSSSDAIEVSGKVYLASTLFKIMGIEKILPFGLIISTREKDGHNIVFMFNFTRADQTISADISKCTVVDKHDCMIFDKHIQIKKDGFIVFYD